MESMVQAQVLAEAASLRAQGAFVPVLKPFNALDLAGDCNNGGGDFGALAPTGVDLGRTWGDLSPGPRSTSPAGPQPAQGGLAQETSGVGAHYAELQVCVCVYVRALKAVRPTASCSY